jgi:hypothetical protein
MKELRRMPEWLLGKGALILRFNPRSTAGEPSQEMRPGNETRKRIQKTIDTDSTACECRIQLAYTSVAAGVLLSVAQKDGAQPMAAPLDYFRLVPALLVGVNCAHVVFERCLGRG